MTAAHRELLADLAAIGASAHLDGDRLVLNAGPNGIPSDLINRLQHARDDLIALLATPPARVAHWGES